jgi:hypothetical protein
MGRIEPDRWMQAADGAEVVLDGAFGEAAPGAEVLGEGVELPFEFRVGGVEVVVIIGISWAARFGQRGRVPSFAPRVVRLKAAA